MRRPALSPGSAFFYAAKLYPSQSGPCMWLIMHIHYGKTACFPPFQDSSSITISNCLKLSRLPAINVIEVWFWFNFVNPLGKVEAWKLLDTRRLLAVV